MMRPNITIHDHSAEANLFLRRTLVAFCIVVFFLLVLLLNLYHLQVELHETYSTRSNDNRIKVIPVAPNRGRIFDRKGNLLAQNVPTFSLEITPEKVKDMDATLAHLQTLLEITPEQIASFKKEVRSHRRFKSIPLKTNLTEEETAIIAVNQHHFSGVSIDARLTRFYPHKDALTHVLGYVGKINVNDLQKIDTDGQSANYAATRDIGKLGIEKKYERQLHGTVGYKEVEINSHGRILRTLRIEPATPGDDLYLSIDLDLQKVVQETLGEHRGAVVAMDPRQGEVLALYSNPSYDPNLFVHGISYRDYSALRDSPKRPLINRATQGQYPPASTVKPIVALLGLDTKTIDKDDTIFDPGFYRIPNVKRKYRDWKKWGHGVVDVVKSIEQSCDTFFYDLAYNLGIDQISDFAARFRFGEKTGIDISEESAGILPSRPWKRALHNQPWYAGDTIAVGIGQGYWTVTPIQLAHATSILAMRGEIHRPHLVTKQQSGDPNQETTVVYQPEDFPPVTINDPSHWETVLFGMRRVVTHGSARTQFKGTTYRAAGKTGTAQVVSLGEDEEYDAENMKESHRDNAMYVGFAPYDAPELVVAVALHNVAKGGGSTNAAPVTRKIMDFYFEQREPALPPAVESLLEENYEPPKQRR